MQTYFGPDGLLAKELEHFEYRASQQKMAEAVWDCFSMQVPLLVEAGTGTGKTWAYLIPAIASGKKIIISTGTKTLQDQILDHDIPLLRKLIHPQLKAVCLKGRKNYLCRRRFRDFSYQPTLWNREEARLFRRFQDWAAKTPSGDRAEIGWLPDRFQTWNEVSSNSDQCLGAQCEDFSRCFLTRVRQDAGHAHLVVVNHHLFFADLALRKKGLGEILPEYDAVVFDEAHQLEDTIGLYFGAQLSNIKLHELMNDLLKECRKDQGKPKSASDLKKIQQMQAIGQQMEALARALYHQLAGPGTSSGRFTLDIEKAGPDFVRTFKDLIHALEQLGALISPSAEGNPALESCHRRSLEMAQAAALILDQSDNSLVYWYELSPQAVFLHATPIDVAAVCREKLFKRTSSIALTSATLSVAGSFDFVRHSLGLPAESRALILPSPFAYEKQALMYVPVTGFAAPHEPDFCRHMSKQAIEILNKTRGRALFLFTSYRNMNEVHQQLKDHVPYPILVQGQKPKRALLSEFREKIDSVLLATSSFWQGIDVPGEALSCLLIDKLPFEVPDDPLIAARMEHLEKKGKNAFFNYQIPRAIIQLKQGVGRLIRSSQDRGIIVIFDVRLFTKGYGKLFLKSLPPCRVVHQLDRLDEFFPSSYEPLNPE